MMHNRSFKTMLTIAAVFGVAFAAPHPKDKVQLNNNGHSVSASWGGFQAGASLADDGSAVASAGGNGLGASAGYGSGGTGASASAFGNGSSAGSKPSKPSAGGAYAQGVGTEAGNGGSHYDKIFAIPVNVLQSVNAYLNQKQQGQQAAAAALGQHNVNGNPNKGTEAGASANGKNGNSMMTHKKINYDGIFNIPITALKSVQNL